MVEHITTLFELSVSYAPIPSFISYGSFSKLFLLQLKKESFIQIIFKHPVRTFEYDNIIIVLQKAMTRKQIH